MTPPLTAPTPLYRLAAEKDSDLSERFERRSNLMAEARSIADRVREDGRASVNRKPEALLGFLTEGRMLNHFEFATRQASARARPVDEVLRQGLGPFYERRVAFEKAMGGEHRFYYAALNIGGLGSPRYGPYCIVLQSGPGNPRTHEPVWVREDSLKGPWWTDEDGLEEQRLSEGLATPPAGHILAALKMTEGGTPGPEVAWPNAVANDRDYVEALFTTAPACEDALEVRASRAHVAELEERVLEILKSGVVPLLEPELLVYSQIRDKLDELGKAFVEVEP